MGNWTDITPSEYAWEREALAYLKAGLPDAEPYRGFGPFTFTSGGRLMEVDALVVTPKGVFLIEIKSRPGTVSGDAGTWQWFDGERLVRAEDNPLIWTDGKAKRLKGLLEKQPALRDVRIPFIAALVFLSAPGLRCELDESGRSSIFGLDLTVGEDPRQLGGLRGIRSHLTRMTADEHARLKNRKVGADVSAAIGKALDQAGVRPSEKWSTVGNVKLGDRIADEPGYVDFAATEVGFPNLKRLVRIYASQGTSDQDRARATRAARREFQLLSPPDVRHEGIARVLDVEHHPLGEAIVYECDGSEVPLDDFMTTRGSGLTLAERVLLVRRLVDALAFAHSRGLFHRGLSPASVRISAPETPDPRPVVLGWQEGLRATGAGGFTVTGTVHLAGGSSKAACYQAPEALTVADPDPRLLDVFSLGALAHLILTDMPPASSAEELRSLLVESGHVDVGAAMPDAPQAMIDFVAEATAGNAAERADSAASLLILLDVVEEHLTRPAPAAPLNPAETLVGDRLGDYVVERNLGEGSTAHAFLVRTPEGGRAVLKVAKTTEQNARIRSEGHVLARLRQRAIVELLAEPFDIGDRATLLLAYADGGDLRHRLLSGDPLDDETLERWAEDLLEAVEGLERVAVHHRDIKPENLGVMTVGPGGHEHLVLLDFSLADAPDDEIYLGTPPYLDPFLGAGGRHLFDEAADRFSAAIVLHEMATGTPPVCGDGRSDPLFSDDAITVDEETLRTESRGALAAFFERALRRASNERYPDAKDMQKGWRRAMDAAGGELSVPTVAAPIVSEPEAEPDPLLTFGPFTVHHLQSGVAFQGRPPGADPDDEDASRGSAETYRVQGPGGLDLVIADVSWPGGDRMVHTTDVVAGARRFERLVRGLRLTVADTGDGLRVELAQARLKDDEWSNLRKASIEELNEGAGLDVRAALEEIGQVECDTREHLLGDTSTRRNYMCATFGYDDTLVPLGAYVLTRVAPLQYQYAW